MKKRFALILTAALLLALTACGGGQKENSRIESKGLFVLEPRDGLDLSGEGLSPQEAYLIHIYDVTPDESKNEDFSSAAEDFTITLNDANTYESVTGSSGSVFLTTLTHSPHYRLDRATGTVFSGAEPFRVLSVFRVNKNDIRDGMSAVFKITNSGVYNCSLDLAEATRIDMPDKLFEVEEDPAQYQLAASMCLRSIGVISQLTQLNNSGGPTNGAALAQFQAGILWTHTFRISACSDGAGMPVYYDLKNDTLYRPTASDTEDALMVELDPSDLQAAVDAVFPELSDLTAQLLAAEQAFTESTALFTATDSSDTQALRTAYQGVTQALQDMESAASQIRDFFAQ